MDISCEVIRDLLPLYHDGVCSKESAKLVEDHLQSCLQCREEWIQMQEETSTVKNIDEAKLIQKTAQVWKKKRKASFLKGALVISLLACAVCIVAFQVIGSYVALDGTLVEPFGFIPLAWLFLFLSSICGVSLALVHKKPNKK